MSKWCNDFEEKNEAAHFVNNKKKYVYKHMIHVIFPSF